MLAGNLREAIENTYQLFPGILERNTNLLFALKIREFIEMISSANKVRKTTDKKEPSVVNSMPKELAMVVDSQEASAGATNGDSSNNGYVTHKSNGLKMANLNEEEMGEN